MSQNCEVLYSKSMGYAFLRARLYLLAVDAALLLDSHINIYYLIITPRFAGSKPRGHLVSPSDKTPERSAFSSSSQRRSVPLKIAPAKRAPLTLALHKFAPEKSALSKTPLRIIASARFAPAKLAREALHAARLAILRFALAKFVPSIQADLNSAPERSA